VARGNGLRALWRRPNYLVCRWLEPTGRNGKDVGCLRRRRARLPLSDAHRRVLTAAWCLRQSDRKGSAAFLGSARYDDVRAAMAGNCARGRSSQTGGPEPGRTGLTGDHGRPLRKRGTGNLPGGPKGLREAERSVYCGKKA
jgi:hypothetical protein